MYSTRHGLRERAAFNGQCPELIDGCLADLRDRLKWILDALSKEELDR